MLVPLREKGEHSIILKLLDLQTDAYEVTKEFTFNRDTVVIFEGVFLFRKELAPCIDYEVFLDISLNTCLERARARDSEETLQKYDTKYFPIQRKDFEEYPPAKVADMVIDNGDWECPSIKYERKS